MQILHGLQAEHPDCLDNPPDGLRACAVAERLAAIWELDLGDWERVMSPRGFGRHWRGNRMDWKTIGNYVLLVGLFVAMVTMFNQVNGRLDTIQAENQRQHDSMNVRIDALQAEMNRRFDTM